MIDRTQIGQYHPQVTFDKVIAHQRKQAKRSTVTKWNPAKQELETLSAYLGDDNCKCAACVVIPDSLLAAMPLVEDMTVHSKYLRTLLKIAGHSQELVYELQVIHDTIDPANWETAWQELAIARGLKYSKKIDASLLTHATETV
jgi:hypothetical protein